MEVIVSTELSLMQETVDLVCAYVNQIRPEWLTTNLPYCLPVTEVTNIMDQVCAGLNRDEGRLRFYFQGFPLDGPSTGGVQTVCVASLLTHTCLEASGCDLKENRRMMHGHMLGDGRFYKIETFSGSGLSVTPSDEYCSLSNELIKMPMPDELRMRMIETLSNFHHHVDTLFDLMEPLALRLRPLLEQWSEKLEPRVERWRTVLATEEGIAQYLARFNVNMNGLQRIVLSMRLFYPDISTCRYMLNEGILYCGTGLALQPVREEQGTLTQVEMMALRLLTGADRIEMLRAMSGRVMSPKDIARELGINPGTIFRDLNSLTMAHLLELVVEGRNRSYTTNLGYIERLAERLVKHIRNGN